MERRNYSQQPVQLPPEVYYRRRRAAAGVIIVLVAALFIWLAVALGGNSTETETTAETSSALTSSSSTATASTEATSEPSTTSTITSVEPNTEAVAADAKRTCTLQDLKIEATTDQPNYSADIMPRFYMTVSNPTAADCEIDMTQAIPRFEVYDLRTNQRIWADIDCNPAVAQGTQTLGSGEKRYYEAVWSRTSSSEGGCSTRQTVASGSYYLHTVIGDNASLATPFNLA
ncbi:putative secreted protein [Corynebacterium kutscheri]|uniref:Secreted protein n=1 Tax=Corynebacterium kutscheri TaxID=35755 RepID=A0A0F6QYS3_9CORY|nr:hypothetical protein [Corynebacterium kutscheri]AKE40752.1 hypothetical protein UL82_02635 [Corynebacterium kutscheri]VEH04572.1 putative secreted protein [Corynebacterium kutscheri]VEH11150.1 putative secreted protein [Corynebacterium kutscheri]VEH80373.1 putative secreted protein [Corynebacterium kutscheri]